jgi:hypothetical protein
MTSRELAAPPPAARRDPAPSAGAALASETGRAALIVAVLTVVGVVFRVLVADQSIFADELSTYWISATHGLGGVLSLLYGTGRIAHAEITPPLYFVLAWLTTRLGDSPELLRLPSLIAGTATIPIVYLLGLRTVGRRAALVATAVTALAPFAIYYSADARAYGVMMLAVLVSTVAMLQALDTGRAHWWGLYAISACVAFYSHYTCAFVLGAQLLWVLWARPEARRAAVLATVAAGVGVLPWLPGLINDYRSPTVQILNALSPFTFSDIRIDLAHWVIGYPETFAGGLTRLPGKPALILFAATVLIGGLGLIRTARGASVRARLAAVDRRVVLIVGLALATPLAELVLGLAGNSLFSVRDLGASWPYLALTGGAVLALSGPRAVLLGAALALIAFALGAVKMLGGDFQRPDYRGAASYIAQSARPGDVVVDETGALSPGPLTGLDVALHRRLPIVRAQAPAERDHPFGFLDPIVPLQQAVAQAVAAAHGHRVFLVTNAFVTDIASLAGRVNAAPSQFPADYRLTAERAYPGVGATLVTVYTDVGAQSK